MKKVFRLIVLVLLLGGWSLAALSLHVIRTDGKIVVIPKASLDLIHGWRDTYVDTRSWTLDDLMNHPAVVVRIIQTEKAELLQHVAPTVPADKLAAELKAAAARVPVPAKPAQRASLPTE